MAPNLHKVKPRETTGRDTILRFDYQFRAAGCACLQILEDNEINRVFCDYHDDYVVKKVKGGKTTYLFHQVKTKNKKHDLFSRKEIFGVNKRKNDAKGSASKSYAGKLFYHILTFGDSCESLHIVANTQFETEIWNLLEDIATTSKIENVPERSKDLVLRIADTCIKDFSDEEKVIHFLRIFKLEPDAVTLSDESGVLEAQYLNRIYSYTEIELTLPQAKHIAHSLLDLIKRKSLNKIEIDITESDLDAAAGVSLEDLLNVLSISKDGYDELKKGGDIKALKTASLLQRILSRSGAPESMIIHACRSKVSWDNWARENRHIFNEFEMMYLHNHILDILRSHLRDIYNFSEVLNQITAFKNELSGKSYEDSGLTEEHLIGLFFSLASKGDLV